MMPNAIDHIVLTVSDYDVCRHFFGDLLGYEINQIPTHLQHLYAGALYFRAGEVEIFLLKHDDTPSDDRFDEKRIGLDHLAFVAPDEDFLVMMAEKLINAGVETKGVEVFSLTGTKYVAFRGPDNLQLEYWHK